MLMCVILKKSCVKDDSQKKFKEADLKGFTITFEWQLSDCIH